MKSVIGYARVSTKKQADEGASLSDQRLQIQEFAKHNKLTVRKFYLDVDSARNEDDGSERPEFNKAVERSLKTKWPIIAASADRFTRTGSTYDRFVAAGGRAYGAREGFGVDESVMRAAIVRAEREGNRISRTTRRGQERATANGVKFGNPEIEKARAASIVARKANASKCREEFRAQFFNAKVAGVETDAELVDFLNDRKFRSPQGRAWTRANVGRMRRELEAAGCAEPSGAEGDPIVGPDGWITPSGFDRVRRFLVAKRIPDSNLRERLYVFSSRRLSDEAANGLTLRIIESENKLRARAEAEELRWGSF
jgi:DNA invertase Pin-like site-specific DNA recombinase